MVLHSCILIWKPTFPNLDLPYALFLMKYPVSHGCKTFFSAPCVPQNLSASMSCSNNTATVSWGSSQGAVLYSVTASSVNGSSANCTSGSTSCVLSPLTCGERYTVTVRAVGTNCSSEVSPPVQIQAGNTIHN